MALPEVGLTAVIENMPKFNKQAKQITDSYNDINKGSDKVAKKSGILGTALGGLGKTMLSLGTVAATAAVAGIGAVTAGMTALGVASVKTAMDFESQMAILSTAVDPAEASMKDLSEAALAVGSDTSLVGVSASEAAEAMTGLFKAGLDVNDVFGDMQGFVGGTVELGGALRASADLAAASELDLAAASSVVTVAMSTFGKTAEEATDIANNFVQAADASQADVNELAAALVNIGPIAASFGFTLEDTNNALAILSDSGIKGAQAGTALRSMFTNLQRPTDKVTDTLNMLGVSLFDTEGNMKDMRTIIVELSEALAEDATITRAVGGASEKLTKQAEKARDAIPGLTTKISEQEQQLSILQRELSGTVEKYGDASTQADKKRLAITKLTNDIEENRIKLATNQSTIGNYETALASAGTEAAKLTEEQRNQAIMTIAGIEGLTAFNTLIGEGAEGWDEMAEKTAAASTASEIALVRSNTLEGAMEALEGTIETLKIGIGNALIPVLTKFAKTAADFVNENGPLLEAIFQRIADNIETLFGILTGEVAPEDVFPPALISLGKWLIDTLPTAIQTTSDFFKNELIPTLSTVFKWLSENIPKAIATAKTFFTEQLLPAIRRLQEFFAPTIERLKEGFQGFLEELKPLIPEMQRLLPVVISLAKILGGALLIALKVLGEVVAFLLPFVGQMFTAMVTTAIDLLEGLVEFVEGAVEMIVGLFTGDMDKARKGAAKVLKGLTKIFKAALKGWLKQFTVVFEAIFKLFGTTLDDMLDDTKDFIRNATRSISNFLDNIKASFKKTLQDISDFFERIWDDISDFVKKVLNDIERFIENKWDDIKDSIEDALDDIERAVKDTFSDIVSAIANRLVDILSNVDRKWKEIKRNIEDRLEEIKSAVTTKFEEIKNVVKSKLESLADIPNQIADLLRGIGTAIVQKILDGISGFTSFVSQVVNQLSSWMGQLITSVLTGLQAAVAVGQVIVARIISGITNFTGFVSIVIGKIASWLSSVIATATAIWNKAIAIGEEIIDRILEGFGNLRDDFIQWVRDRLEEWLGEVFSPIPAARHMGEQIAQEIMTGFALQQPALISQMRNLVGGVTLPTVTASLAMAPSTVSGPPLGATSGTTINNAFNLGGNTFVGNQMGPAEFDARVVDTIRRELR